MLEPIMSVEASTPTDYQGDIMGDLNRRRGQISNMENKANACILKAMVPCPKCSVIPPPSEPFPVAALPIPWSPPTLNRCPQNLVDQIVSEKAK